MPTTIEEKIVDSETGELLHTYDAHQYRCDEPKFVKLYIDAWCEFKEVKAVNSSFLLQVLKRMHYANDSLYPQVVTLAAYDKKQIAEELGWKKSNALKRCDNELGKLVKSDVLRRVDRGIYVVNPELIGKGEWKDILKMRAIFNLETGKVSPVYVNHAEETVIEEIHTHPSPVPSETVA